MGVADVAAIVALTAQPCEEFYGVQSAHCSAHLSVAAAVWGEELIFCVLKAVFMAAWRQHFVQPTDGEYPLRFANAFRNAAWWETIQCLSTPHKRRRIGCQHSSRGQPASSWEHPFIQAWGPHWCNRRDACASAEAWSKCFSQFLEMLSRHWELPWLCPDADQAPFANAEPWTSLKLPSLVENPPLIIPNPREQVWASDHRRLWIQSDNPLVANAFSGEAALCTTYLQPICIRIARKLQMLLHTGWKPRLNTVAFIEWDPRHFNAVADHAANAALDCGREWRHRVAGGYAWMALFVGMGLQPLV